LAKQSYIRLGGPARRQVWEFCLSRPLCPSHITLIRAATSTRNESTEYEGMVDFHWGFDRASQANELANSFREGYSKAGDRRPAHHQRRRRKPVQDAEGRTACATLNELPSSLGDASNIRSSRASSATQGYGALEIGRCTVSSLEWPPTGYEYGIEFVVEALRWSCRKPLQATATTSASGRCSVGRNPNPPPSGAGLRLQPWRLRRAEARSLAASLSRRRCQLV
jgi:hypothetical protein